MPFRLLFVALIAIVIGVAILQQSIWGEMNPRDGAIAAFIGCASVSTAIILGILAYLVIQYQWQDLYSPALLLSPILLTLSVLGAIRVFICRRSLA